jgi:hypothetical protein
MGGEIMVNPWSLMHCLGNKRIAAYWIGTGSDELLKQKIKMSLGDSKMISIFYNLLSGKSVIRNVFSDYTAKELNHPRSLVFLALYSGYLTASVLSRNGFSYKCELKLPNVEVRANYMKIFMALTKDELRMDEESFDCMIKLLLRGEIAAFQSELKKHLLTSMSYLETGKIAESFYSGFMNGIFLVISKTHIIENQRESGLGRTDIILKPRRKQTEYSLPIIVEVKIVLNQSELKKAAQEAVDQSIRNQYDVHLKNSDEFKEILYLGIAFYKKDVEMCAKKLIDGKIVDII